MKIIAHRGFSSKFPENTFLAFEKAYSIGARIIEFDVNLTKDKIPIILHDDTLDRTSDLKGNIQNFKYNKIENLDVGSWKNKNFKDARIPLLGEVLDWAKEKKDLNLNIEIKSSAHVKEIQDDNIEYQILKMLDKRKLKNRVFISSFEINSLKRIRSIDSKIKLSLLPENSDLLNGTIFKMIEEINPYSINVPFQIFTNSFLTGIKNEFEIKIFHTFLKHMKNHSIQFFCYTVNSKSNLKVLIENNVAGIFTDMPELFI